MTSYSRDAWLLDSVSVNPVQTGEVRRDLTKMLTIWRNRYFNGHENHKARPWDTALGEAAVNLGITADPNRPLSSQDWAATREREW